MIRKDRHILVVSDDGASGLLLELLSAQAFSVSHTTDDAPGILDSVHKALPDLVLVDRDTSVDFGIGLCRSLKKSLVAKHIPVILFATLPELQEREKAFEAGCYDLITKPFSSSEVLVRISNCLLHQSRLQQLEKMVEDRTEQLRLSEARFKNIFISLSIGAMIFRPVKNGADFSIIDFNPAAERIEGIKRKEAVGRRVTRVFPGIEAFGLVDTFRRVRETGKPEHHPAGVYRDQKRQGWRDNYVFKLPSGEIVSLYRDVTKQKQQEQLKDLQVKISGLALEYSSEELCHIFLDEIGKITHSRTGFFHLTAPGRSVIKFHAWSSGSFRNPPPAGRDTGEIPMEKAGAWTECIRTQQPVLRNRPESLISEKELPPGHVPVTRELVVPVIRNNRVPAILGVGNRSADYKGQDAENLLELADMAWDVIARKRTEEQLQLSERRFSKMFLSSPDAMMLVRFDDGMILDINRSFSTMFGYSRELAIGKTVQTIGLWMDGPEIGTVLDRLNRGRKVRNFELRAKRASGVVFDVSISCDTTRIDRDICLIVIIRDISKRKMAEKERQAIETQLIQSRKMESIGTLAGGITHDFNNILSAIVGYTQLAMSELPEDSEPFNKLENVLEAGSRASELVSQILTFSRKEEQEPRPLNIRLVVKEALKLIRSSIPSTIRIKQDIPADSGMVLADPTQIHQVVMNICTNAYQAMKDTGGTLAVRLFRVGLGRRGAGAGLYLKPGPYEKIEISDTGPGIPEQVRERIFEPYYTTKEKGEGTGLGLAVVHGIITALNGGVTVDSDPGQGTTFSIYLPATGSPGKPTGKRDTVRILTGNEKILLVDDDETLVDVNTTLLKKLGYAVTGLTSSLEAFNLFQNDPDAFDLVITDMTMPYITGDRLGEKMLAIRPGMPIILTTGHSEANIRTQAKAKGIRGFLRKPTIKRLLAEEIRRCLDGAKTRGNA